ncbi:MAG: hypothetical protein ACRCTF_04350 [Bacteroidales bacterium]
MKRRLTSILLLGLMVSSCTTSRDDAEKRLENATKLFESGQYNLAKIEIDSLRSKHPKEFDQIRGAITLMRSIELKEQERTFAFCDSMLTQLTQESELLKKNFDFRSNPEYDKVGRWIQRDLLSERNSGRNYLRAEVFENGEMQLTSSYEGAKAIKHTMIKVSLKDGTFSQSDEVPFDGGRNYRFNDEGTHHERVTFNLKTDGGIAQFIATYSDQPMTLTYEGGIKYQTQIDQKHRAALKESFDLSSRLLDMRRLVEERRVSEAKINLLRKKLEQKNS